MQDESGGGYDGVTSPYDGCRGSGRLAGIGLAEDVLDGLVDYEIVNINRKGDVKLE